MEGYAKLSSLMATDPEFAIYRKFGALNAQNLLYYQAELIDLEEELQQIAARDRRSQDSEKRLFAENWFELSNAKFPKDVQYKKVLQLRKVLKEYSPQYPTSVALGSRTDNSGITDKCLIQQAKIAKIERPLAYNLKMLRRWLSNSTYGDSFLVGLEQHTWDQSYDNDFIAIPRPDSEMERDTLSRLFLGPLLEFYHNVFGRFHMVNYVIRPRKHA